MLSFLTLAERFVQLFTIGKLNINKNFVDIIFNCIKNIKCCYAHQHSDSGKSITFLTTCNLIHLEQTLMHLSKTLTALTIVFQSDFLGHFSPSHNDTLMVFGYFVNKRHLSFGLLVVDRFSCLFSSR